MIVFSRAWAPIIYKILLFSAISGQKQGGGGIPWKLEVKGRNVYTDNQWCQDHT